MDEERLSQWRNYVGMVPASPAARNYRLGDIVVRNSRKKCLIPVGNLESWAAGDCKDYAASMLRDIHSACAAWTTDEFMTRVQEEAASMPVVSYLYRKTYNGEAVKVNFGFSGYDYMTSHNKKSSAALVSWLAKPKASATKAPQRSWHAVYYHALDQGWKPKNWKPNRLRAITEKGKGNLDNNRFYIITGMLVASAVPTKKHSNDSASAGVKPLPEAAPANFSQDDNQASQNGAPKVVAYHVIEVEYDTVSGKLQHVGRLHKPHQYDCLARDKKSYAPSKNSPLV